VSHVVWISGHPQLLKIGKTNKQSLVLNIDSEIPQCQKLGIFLQKKTDKNGGGV